jgi:hypothetical protein
MIRLFFIYFSFVQLLFAYNYDDLLLKAQSSIFPKIMLLDKKVKNKLIENKVVYTIVYDNNDYETALHVKNYIDTVFKGHFNGYLYEINIVDFEHMSMNTKASAFYVLKSFKKNIEKVANIARQKGVITFSYDIENLKYGLLLSLIIQKSTVIYLNKENLTKDIDFVDFLFQMVKFIDNNNI